MTAARLVALGVLAGALACGPRQGRSPTQLRDAHVAALRADDPAAAYALLTPEARASTSFEEFEARWKANTQERKAAIVAAEQLGPEHAEPIHGGTTVHREGHVLRWTAVGDELLVAEGLPGRPDTSTPAQTIRAFVTAVRTAQLQRVQAVLADELLEAIGEDWAQRVDAIEDALVEPGALDLSPDLRRAELRYAPGRVLTLEQTPQGWRITGLR